MLEELRWKTSLSATALYVALCRARGIEPVDAAAGPELTPAVDALVAEIEAAEWQPLPLLQQLISLATELDNNSELVARAVTRLRLPPRDSSASVRIVGAIADLEAALLRAQPNLAEELAVRGGPLREQWETRGPGMMREIGRLTEEQAIPHAAEMVIVSPYVGGHGIAYPPQNRVIFAGMLFNPLPNLPETVRLAWLLAQLNGDLPRYADLLPVDRRESVFAAAMLAPTLAAAQEVELATCDEPALVAAFEAWGLAAEFPPDSPARIWTWWNAWLDQPATWPVAVAALDRLLA